MGLSSSGLEEFWQCWISVDCKQSLNEIPWRAFQMAPAGTVLSTHPPGPFSCNYCGQPTEDFASLQAHAMDVHHIKNYQPYICTWPGCSRLFSFDSSLKRHLRIHTNAKPLRCKLCDYCCRNHSSLKWHIASVHGQLERTASRTYKEQTWHVLAHSNDTHNYDIVLKRTGYKLD